MPYIVEEIGDAISTDYDSGWKRWDNKDASNKVRKPIVNKASVQVALSEINGSPDASSEVRLWVRNGNYPTLLAKKEITGNNTDNCFLFDMNVTSEEFKVEIVKGAMVDYKTDINFQVGE